MEFWFSFLEECADTLLIVLAIVDLAAKGLAPGASGNLSIRMDSGMLISPTGAQLGSLSIRFS